MVTSLLMQYDQVEAVTLNLLSTYSWWQILFESENFHIFNFIEVALRHVCFPAYLLHIFRTPFLKNTSEGLLLYLFF